MKKMIFIVDKLPKNKKKRRLYLLQHFGSDIVDSGFAYFVDENHVTIKD